MEKFIILNYPNIVENILNMGKNDVMFCEGTLNHNAISVMIGIFFEIHEFFLRIIIKPQMNYFRGAGDEPFASGSATAFTALINLG